MKRIIFIILGAVVVFFAAVYLLYQPATDRFPAKSSVNGIDVSGLTPAEAATKLSDIWKSKDFSFDYKEQLYTVPMESLTFDPPVASIMPSLSHFQKFRYFLRQGNKFEVPMTPTGSEEFFSKISGLSLCDNSERVKTTDAYIDLSDFEFRIVYEKIGTEVDPQAVRDIALANIANGVFHADLTDDEVIKKPEITGNSKVIRDQLKYYQDNLSFKLEYEIDGETEVLTPKMLEEMVTYGEKGPEVNDDKIDDFVYDVATRCNEYNRIYSFTSHSGREISVQAVTFGNVIDKAGMKETLKKALEDQKDQKLELQWSLYKYSGGEGIGDSYIEVSIDQQHVWCYKDGKVVVDCDCVTGLPGHDTVKGVYIVQNVTGPTVLRGDNDDGTKYESPVNCFIPFYGGQGFHGSNGWRSQWGGNIYKTAGSHGCVNCPDAAAKKIADTVRWGYPVVIY